MLQEFKDFAMKGNVLDLAVAVVIGAAFGKIVSSLVDNLITPLVGLFMGGVDFSGLSYEVGDAVFGYGAFAQSVIDFVIVRYYFLVSFQRTTKTLKMVSIITMLKDYYWGQINTIVDFYL